MDFQEAFSSSTREKVDFVLPIIRDKESKWNHRKSLAWDTAFFTNPGVLDPEELFGSLKIDENESEVGVNHKQYSIKTLPCVSSKINARPSFAWDNAFFTDPGVLDAEELSLVNNGFTTTTQPRKSTDSMTTTTTQGSRFSVASIESDLFHDLRASLRDSPAVKQSGTLEIEPKLPVGKKTKGDKQKDQPLSLIPQPKIFSFSSSSSSSISKLLTPRQAKPEKKCAASEIGMNKGKHKSHGFGDQSGSKSIIRSPYSSHAVKDLRSSSSGLRLPLPKMGFFDSENNGEKENREPDGAETTATRRRRHKSKLETSSPPENRSILGQRKTRK